MDICPPCPMPKVLRLQSCITSFLISSRQRAGVSLFFCVSGRSAVGIIITDRQAGNGIGASQGGEGTEYTGFGLVFLFFFFFFFSFFILLSSSAAVIGWLCRFFVCKAFQVLKAFTAGFLLPLSCFETFLTSPPPLPQKYKAGRAGGSRTLRYVT